MLQDQISEKCKRVQDREDSFDTTSSWDKTLKIQIGYCIPKFTQIVKHSDNVLVILRTV